jgi:hypothetical protein
LNQSTRSNPIRPPARIAANKDEASASNSPGERAVPSSMRPNILPGRRSTSSANMQKTSRLMK